MRRTGVLVLAFAVFGVTGCFHQVVETGLTPAPGGATINRTAGVAFWGLKAAEVDARQECTNGVAVVETQQTFMNGLISALTLGIYNPQTVTITCAAGSSPDADAPRVSVPGDATSEEVEAAVLEAIQMAMETGEPVFLHFVP
jgi:hypothetical protein